MQTGECITLRQAAAQFGLSYSQLRLLARSRKLHAWRIGHAGGLNHRFRRSYGRAGEQPDQVDAILAKPVTLHTLRDVLRKVASRARPALELRTVPL